MKKALWLVSGILLAYLTVCLYFAFKTYPYTTVSEHYELNSPNGKYVASTSYVEETSWWDKKRFIEFNLNEKSSGNSLRKIRLELFAYNIGFTPSGMPNEIVWTEDSTEVSFSMLDTIIKIDLDTPYKLLLETLDSINIKND
jgi:hypothetical protein